MTKATARPLAQGRDFFAEAFRAAGTIRELVSAATARADGRKAEEDGLMPHLELTTNEYAAMGRAAREITAALREVAL